MTSSSLHALPDGHTWHQYNIGGESEFVVYFIAENSGERGMLMIRPYEVGELLQKDSDGKWQWIPLPSNTYSELLGLGGLTIVAAIKDSEFPVEDITPQHTQFNPDTGKYEFRNIEAEIFLHHERQHDSDVAAADAAICEVEIDIMHRKAVLVNLNPDQKAHARAEYADFDDCIDNIVDVNAEPSIELAHLKSLGDVRHDGGSYPERTIVNAAHDFAAAWLTHLNSRTKAQLGARRYEYNICMRNSLIADRGKTSNRFLPRGVTIVKRKSTPAKAEEMTAAQVFAKVKALVSPAEGAPKRA